MWNNRALLVLIVYILCMLLGSVWSGNIQGVAVNNTLTLGYLVSWEQGIIFGPYVGSAIIVGIQEVRRRGLLPGYDIEWVLRDDYCEPRRGIYETVDIWASVEDLDGFIGSVCSVVCQPQSLLAASWGIPVISWSCTSTSLADKEVYPTFTTLQALWANREPVFDSMADMFGWNTIGIISTQEDLFKDEAVGIMEEMQRNGKDVVLRIVATTIRGDQIDVDSYNVLTNVMIRIKSLVRIIILMTYPIDLRNILIVALDLGMMNGEYVFITNENIILTSMGIEQTYRPEADDIIYNGVLGMGNIQPSGPEYDTFRQAVIDEFQNARFDHLPHLSADASIDEVNMYAGNILIYFQNEPQMYLNLIIKTRAVSYPIPISNIFII